MEVHLWRVWTYMTVSSHFKVLQRKVANVMSCRPNTPTLADKHGLMLVIVFMYCTCDGTNFTGGKEIPL